MNRRMQMIERCEVIANDDQMHQALHVDVVVQNRRRTVQLKLPDSEDHAQSGALARYLRHDLRRAAEQRKRAGLLARSRPNASDRERRDRYDYDQRGSIERRT